MTAREEVREVLEMLPDDCSIDDIQYTRYVRQSIRAGLADLEAGRVHSHEDVERMVEEWFGEEW